MSTPPNCGDPLLSTRRLQCKATLSLSQPLPRLAPLRRRLPRLILASFWSRYVLNEIAEGADAHFEDQGRVFTEKQTRDMCTKCTESISKTGHFCVFWAEVNEEQTGFPFVAAPRFMIVAAVTNAGTCRFVPVAMGRLARPATPAC